MINIIAFNICMLFAFIVPSSIVGSVETLNEDSIKIEKDIESKKREISIFDSKIQALRFNENQESTHLEYFNYNVNWYEWEDFKLLDTSGARYRVSDGNVPGAKKYEMRWKHNGIRETQYYVEILKRNFFMDSNSFKLECERHAKKLEAQRDELKIEVKDLEAERKKLQDKLFELSKQTCETDAQTRLAKAHTQQAANEKEKLEAQKEALRVQKEADEQLSSTREKRMEEEKLKNDLFIKQTEAEKSLTSEKINLSKFEKEKIEKERQAKEQDNAAKLKLIEEQQKADVRRIEEEKEKKRLENNLDLRKITAQSEADDEKIRKERINKQLAEIAERDLARIKSTFTKEEIEKQNQAKLAEIEAQKKADLAKTKAVFDNFKHFIDTPGNMTKIIGYSTTGVFTLTGMFYAVRYVYNYKISTMHKPTLVRESSLSFSSGSFLEKFWGNNKKSVVDLNEIILPPTIKEQAHKLAQAAKKMHSCGLPFENVLIYGPPGTGKTAFIKLLAKYSDMDYVILSGADFCQFKNGEGIIELHKLFDLAKNTKKGLVIFIDEADACFRNRLEVSTELVNLINAFLAETGESSKKALVALATNYDGTLDSAVRSRMHNKIAFMLPSEKERFEIFKLKLKKHILDNLHNKNGQKKGEKRKLFKLSDKLNDSFWEKIAKITEGFSGRDIDFAMQAIRRELELSNTTVLTPEIVTSVIDLKIKEIERDLKTTQTQKALYEQNKGVHLDY